MENDRTLVTVCPGFLETNAIRAKVSSWFSERDARLKPRCCKCPMFIKINPSCPNNDQHLCSPHNITTCWIDSWWEETKWWQSRLKTSWCLNKFSGDDNNRVNIGAEKIHLKCRIVVPCSKGRNSKIGEHKLNEKPVINISSRFCGCAVTLENLSFI